MVTLRYFTINKFSKIVGVTPQTLRNWDKAGKLEPHHTTESGYRYYSEEQLNQVLRINPKPRTVVGYCRVSSPKQKDDLERQIENVRTYLLAQGKSFEIISDIGSGMNYKRKGLLELLDRIIKNKSNSRVRLGSLTTWLCRKKRTLTRRVKNSSATTICAKNSLC